MTFQVLVKTTAVMQGAYTFLLASREERDEFVRRPDVWWYHYPEEDDDWRWHRGGAWKPAHQMTDADYRALETIKPLPPKGFTPGAVVVTEGEDGDDDRWLPGRLVRPLPSCDLAQRRALAARQRGRLGRRPVPQRVRVRYVPVSLRARADSGYGPPRPLCRRGDGRVRRVQRNRFGGSRFVG